MKRTVVDDGKARYSNQERQLVRLSDSRLVKKTSRQSDHETNDYKTNLGGTAEFSFVPDVDEGIFLFWRLEWLFQKRNGSGITVNL